MNKIMLGIGQPLSHCHGCGKFIIWVMFDNTRLPVELGPPTYVFRSWVDHQNLPFVDQGWAFVSHLNTCTSLQKRYQVFREK